MTQPSNSDDSLKQVIIIRTDLNLSAGKSAAQAAHASLWAAGRANDDNRAHWEAELATKIVLGIDTEDALRNLESRARTANLPTALVNDAGRTEVESGTTTALGIGPAPTTRIDQLTGNLPLYQ